MNIVHTDGTHEEWKFTLDQLLVDDANNLYIPVSETDAIVVDMDINKQDGGALMLISLTVDAMPSERLTSALRTLADTIDANFSKNFIFDKFVLTAQGFTRGQRAYASDADKDSVDFDGEK